MQSYDDTISNFVQLLNKLVEAPKFTFKKVKSTDVPKRPGNYLITSSSGVVYIGTSGNLNRRILNQHKLGNIGGSNFRRTVAIHFLMETTKETSPELEAKISQYILQNFSFQYILIDDYVERIKFEHFATAILSPILNLLPQKIEKAVGSNTSIS